MYENRLLQLWTEVTGQIHDICTVDTKVTCHIMFNKREACSIEAGLELFGTE